MCFNKTILILKLFYQSLILIFAKPAENTQIDVKYQLQF